MAPGMASEWLSYPRGPTGRNGRPTPDRPRSGSPCSRCPALERPRQARSALGGPEPAPDGSERTRPRPGTRGGLRGSERARGATALEGLPVTLPRPRSRGSGALGALEGLRRVGPGARAGRARGARGAPARAGPAPVLEGLRARGATARGARAARSALEGTPQAPRQAPDQGRNPPGARSAGSLTRV